MYSDVSCLEDPTPRTLSGEINLEIGVEVFDSAHALSMRLTPHPVSAHTNTCMLDFFQLLIRFLPQARLPEP